MNHGNPQAEYLAARIERKLDVPLLIALLRGGEEMLAAVLDPLHRPLEPDGEHRHHRLLDVEHRFRAEASAHIGVDDAQAPGIPVEEVHKGFLLQKG